ncbi:hypothetical protein G7B40_023750 [Aetokthonos hydrillicola Thurmond2011]|jgi:hypothetical protein|uniref:STAS/SEC14 domain-containing protein n=1 Tax=Aetokthonos hydrillicola Thurmond2011 TaxID=2712845 RepID=A0AAP5MB54_9CYAN|nr:hypothetical protein [Aetokthonos hydrillicola]MBO3460235.1 hypothetical protein [Aetokthonos hydrillicola CCALA 1050]MBW4586968.1 hypothetical protein [Aetokthonos hydrillicola CCALA 1050]MDR9897557.1 hypothetical protein [Aetokthonos hydrillicola Thurmond2011]
MAAPTEIRRRAIALLEQLPGDSLVRAVEFLEALCDEALQESETTPETNETALVEIIQRRLPSDDQQRLDYLRQRNETEEITDAEHQELLAYIDRVEQQDVERAEALIKLAQLRQVDLKVLIREFLPKHSNVT